VAGALGHFTALGFAAAMCSWNPEQFLTAALAQCHMLWYLHLRVRPVS
jgi:organic hydroperoxide reductase OsmC/OhrA